MCLLALAKLLAPPTCRLCIFCMTIYVCNSSYVHLYCPFLAPVRVYKRYCGLQSSDHLIQSAAASVWHGLTCCNLINMFLLITDSVPTFSCCFKGSGVSANPWDGIFDFPHLARQLGAHQSGDYLKEWTYQESDIYWGRQGRILLKEVPILGVLSLCSPVYFWSYWFLILHMMAPLTENISGVNILKEKTVRSFKTWQIEPGRSCLVRTIVW